MASRTFDPLRLDVQAFAREGATLEGRWPLVGLDRLVDSAAAESRPAPADEVVWSARGEWRPMRGGEGRVWLHLEAATCVALQCQRCLKPVDTPVTAARSFLFVAGDDVAAELDAQTEDDVLAMTRALDLRQLIEDELLLALPLVPRHEACPDPLVLTDADADYAVAHPFAPLAALKPGRLN